MSLSLAYFLLAIPYALAALLLAVAPETLRALPRSRGAAFVLFGTASAWFLHNLTQLGEADLAGIPRQAVLGVFGFSAVGAFILLPDLLAVRGLAGLLLLSASPLLDAGFGKLPQSLPLATLTYALILFAITVGTAPYLLRDLIAATLATPARKRAAVAVTGIAAIICVARGASL